MLYKGTRFCECQLGYMLFSGNAMRLLVVRRHLIVDVADQRYPHLSSIVTPKNITDKVCLNLHVDLYLR